VQQPQQHPGGAQQEQTAQQQQEQRAQQDQQVKRAGVRVKRIKAAAKPNGLKCTGGPKPSQAVLPRRTVMYSSSYCRRPGLPARRECITGLKTFLVCCLLYTLTTARRQCTITRPLNMHNPQHALLDLLMHDELPQCCSR
jgi:hypothetical protein